MKSGTSWPFSRTSNILKLLVLGQVHKYSSAPEYINEKNVSLAFIWCIIHVLRQTNPKLGLSVNAILRNLTQNH